eukprot:COSAG02_NODE_1075_length_14754_cov_18.686796_20_plen_69_part_00
MSFRLHGFTQKSSRKMAAEVVTFDEEYGMFYSSASEPLTVTLIDEEVEGASVELGASRSATTLHWSTA